MDTTPTPAWNPASPPPGPAAPEGSDGADGSEGSEGRGKVGLIAGVVVLVVLVLGAGGFLIIRSGGEGQSDTIASKQSDSGDLAGSAVADATKTGTTKTGTEVVGTTAPTPDSSIVPDGVPGAAVPGNGSPSPTPKPTTPKPTSAPAPTSAPTTAAPPASPAVAITSFTTPESIDCHNGSFQTFSASWTTTNATKTTISIDGPGLYDTYAANDSASLPFNCSAPHTFTLTAFAHNGTTATRAVTLHPRNVQTPTPDDEG